ncbi:LysM peptidoglycan-binding domain-containing C40 family peptidase [Limosilactobacillus fermentum]|uniref:C40 family peptidase n=1 Tax=Limosilactobacillus fermentum TaxID=1613 RepID=UPI000976942D|nr:LysM peptidoglycan-binding domain-containing C40 family peptidase [Limosilactobacillus fermentum]MCJ2387903.1 LysM peptidoglycan-binding domain-containing C40 family peptidase [Limosilactobacillus fermentum]QID94901.1 LysM peptidoglycan-binding domain-containing protein [Limosilactobacillus fermentum]
MLKCAVALGFGTIGLAAAGATAHADTITIQKGDTVWGYSQRYHVTMGDIVKANNLKNPNLIIAGKTIYIPTSDASSASSMAVTASSTATSTATSATSANSAPSSSVTSSSASEVATDTSATSAVSSAVVSANSAADSSATSTTSATSVASASSAVASANSAVSASSDSATSAVASSATTSSSASATSTANTTMVTVSATSASSASSSTASSTTTTSTTTTSASGVATYSAAQAVARAESVIGTPYVYGGNTMSGFDCSGLVQWAYGLSSTYRTTYQQQALGTHHYDVENAPAGAIVFFGSDSAPYHDGISLGNGTFIQAPDTGQTVKITSMSAYTPSYYVVIN